MNDSLGVSNDSTMASKSHETKPIFESGTVPHRETDAAAQSSMSQGGISFATPDDTVEGTAEKLLESAVEDGPGEDWSTIERKVYHSQFDVLGKLLFEREKEKGDIRRRSKQAILHVTFTEMRVTKLEEQLRKLQDEFHNKPHDFKISVARKQCPVYDSFIKRSVSGEFILMPASIETPFNQRPSLEVLVTERGTSLSPEHGIPGHSDDNLPRTQHQTPERLRIRYAPLIKTIEKVCRETVSNHQLFSYSIVEELKSSSTVVLRPWKIFIAYEKEIRNSANNVQKLLDAHQEKAIVEEHEYELKDLLQELQLLIQFIDVDLKPTFDLRRTIQDGTETEIEYADLWHLFKLGDTVISPKKEAQAFRVVNFTGGREPLIRQLHRDGGKPITSVDGFAVDCCSLCFDGAGYVPKMERFLIRKYNGRRSITSLEVFPLKFEQNSQARLRDFEIQGRKYLELTRQPFSHRMFRGITLDEPSQQLDTQVIVDIALAINTEPDWRPTRNVSAEDFTPADERETQMPAFCEHGPYNEGCCGSDYIFKDLNMNYAGFDPSHFDHGGLLGPRTAEMLKQKDIILLPNQVHAFVLRSRQWVTVKLADLSEVSFDNNFEELMFSPEHKQTILALVETHENAAQGSHSVGAGLDLVKGKGTGLIILLHGEPGVGKTSTAECVADKTKRALFPITCGDIGETAMEVEKNLHHNFRLAHRWGCVLLLDEADVFLAKRSKTDLRRNAVTSVFLRSLEYYAGILFLTTNRVGGIDPAFKSRIQLSLYYPRIDIDTTEKLYEVFLRRARAEQLRTGVAQFKIKEKEILKFGRRHFRTLEKEGLNTWNGRQIRNAWQTAIALVEHEAAHTKEGQPKPVLGKQQFEIVAQGSKEFDHYLMRTLQGGDDEIARRDQWRDDMYDDANIKQLSPSKPRPKAPSSRVGGPMVTDPESDDSDDSDSETEDGEDEGSNIHATNERQPNVDTEANAEEDQISSADIKDFLRFMARKGKSRKT